MVSGVPIYISILRPRQLDVRQDFFWGGVFNLIYLIFSLLFTDQKNTPHNKSILPKNVCVRCREVIPLPTLVRHWLLLLLFPLLFFFQQ